MKLKKNIHFEISERKILLRVFDVLSVLVILYALWKFTSFEYFSFVSWNIVPGLVLALYLNVLGTIFDMYNLQTASNQLQVIKSIVLTASTTVLFYLLTPRFTPVLPPNRIQIVYFFIAVLLGLILWRIFYQKFIASHRFMKKVVLICDTENSVNLVNDLQRADPHYKVQAVCHLDHLAGDYPRKGALVLPLEHLIKYVQANTISDIVIAAQNTNAITPSVYSDLLLLLESGFSIKEYSQVYETITNRIPIQHMGADFYRYFPFGRSNQNQLYLLLVRLSEILFSITGVACGIVLLPLVLFGNLLGNRGPLFYTQTRVGKNGKSFEIYKFRTMIRNAESGGVLFATAGDVRVTPFGKFLRKTRIDEVPQFINILKGDMGFIGPRPERPFFVKELASVMPFYETRHVIKPGLTGWAQVNYSYGESIEESLIKLQYDLYYIKHRSIFLDLNIVIKTFGTVLFYRGQ